MQLHIYIWIKTSAHRQYKTCETFISTILYFQHLSINTQGLRKKASQYVILSSVMITPKALPPEKTRPQYVLPCILLCNYSDSETSTHQSSLLQPPHSRLNPVCFRSTWQLICIAVLQYSRRGSVSFTCESFVTDGVKSGSSQTEKLQNTLETLSVLNVLHFHLNSKLYLTSFPLLIFCNYINVPLGHFMAPLSFLNPCTLHSLIIMQAFLDIIIAHLL